MKIKFLSLFLLLPCLAQAAESLPPKLSATLDASVATCGFRLYADGTAAKLEKDPAFKKQIVKAMLNKGQTIENIKAAGILTAIGSIGLTTAAILKGGDTSSAFMAGAGVSSAGEISSFGTIKAAPPEYKVSSDKVAKYADEVSRRYGAIFQLDPNRENAFRAAVVKETMRKVKLGDESPINFLKLIKDTKFKGKPILDAGETGAIEAVAENSRQGTSDGEKTDAEKVQFLQACREALRITGGDKEEKVGEKVDAFVADLRSYENAHPKAAKLLPVAKNQEAPENSGADTSMKAD